MGRIRAIRIRAIRTALPLSGIGRTVFSTQRTIDGERERERERDDATPPPRTLTHTHTFTQHHVDAFCHLTDDTNPIHRAPTAPSSATSPIVPGILSASLFPSLISKHHPGSIYVSQTLTFRHPIPVDQPVHVHLERRGTRHGLAQFSCTISLSSVSSSGVDDDDDDDDDATIAVDGIATVKLPSPSE